MGAPGPLEPAGPVGEETAPAVERPTSTSGKRLAVGVLLAFVVGAATLATMLLSGGSDRSKDPRSRQWPVPTSGTTDGSPDLRTVFYVTDRERFVPDAAWYALRFVWPVLVLAVGMALILWLRRAGERRRRLIWLRVFHGLALTAVTAYAVFEVVHMKQVADRVQVLYGGERFAGAGGLPYEMGTCQVSIPPNHRRGELERPSPWKGDFWEDPQRHFVMLDVVPMEAEGFYGRLRALVAGSTNEDAFVFVHGYNVPFEDAVLRTGQIAYDLGFDGAPILFSWPSQGRKASYPVDETNSRWATPHLARFLADLRERSGAKRLHLVAHSMGNRVLVEALERVRADAPGVKFDQVVLAAPDIDADTFAADVPRILPVATRVTLYASSEDEAITLSKTFHGYRRAGDSTPSVVVVSGMDSIDVSGVTSSHSYIGDNGFVLSDLGTILLKGDPVDRRPGLRLFEQLKYWVLEAVRGG